MKTATTIQIRLTGRTGQVDGYMEIILGTLVMSNLLITHRISVKRRPHQISQIYLDLTLVEPPLGNIGEIDLPPYQGDNE